MPTSSPLLTTGSRRMRCSAIIERASDSCVSGVTVIVAVVAMSSRRTSRGSFRSARTRTTRSRSVTRPSSRPSSATGITPVSNCFIIAAASAAFIPGPAVSGDSVMAWRTRIDMASPPSSRMTYPEPVTGKPDWEGLEGSRVEISSAADRLNPGGRVDLRGHGGHTPERRPPGTAPSPSGVCRLRSSVGKDGVLVLGFPVGHGRAQQVGQDEICLCQPNVPAHLVSSGSSVVRPLVSDGWPTDLNGPFGARARRVTFGGMLKRVKRSRVVRIAQATADRYGDDAGGYLAAAIAFYGFLSFFPLVLLGVSIVGFAFESSPGLQEEVETALTRSVPGVEPLVTQSLRAAREARVSLGLVGLAGLLWTGTGVVGAGRNAVRTVFREGSQMAGLRRMAWLLAVTIGLGVVAREPHRRGFRPGVRGVRHHRGCPGHHVPGRPAVRVRGRAQRGPARGERRIRDGRGDGTAAERTALGAENGAAGGTDGRRRRPPDQEGGRAGSPGGHRGNLGEAPGRGGVRGGGGPGAVRAGVPASGGGRGAPPGSSPFGPAGCY